MRTFIQDHPLDRAQPGIWLDLETILNLPLQSRDLAVVWRQILLHPSLEDAPPDNPVKRELAQAISQLELTWALELCREGQWSEGLNRLEGLWETTDFAQTLAPEMLNLLPDLHYQLVDLAEESPPRCPFDEAERAELLWCCHNWLVRLNASGLEQPERMAAIHEQIYRYGALAWMSLQTPLANRRSLELLLALSEVNPVAHAWAKPACVQRLEHDIEALLMMLRVTQPTPELLSHLNDLIRVARRFENIFQTPIDRPSPSLIQTLLDAKSTLEVWAQLKPC